MESALPQRPVLHVQHQCELDEGLARDPVWLRLSPPSDEPLAAGAGRRSARLVRLSINARHGPEPRRDRSRRWVPGRHSVLRERLERPGGLPAGHADGHRKEQPVHQDGQPGEPVRSLHSRPLARHSKADAEPWACAGSFTPTGRAPPAWASNRTIPRPTKFWSAGAAASRRTTEWVTARSCLRRASVSPISWDNSTVIRSGYGHHLSTRIPGALRRCAAGIPLTIVAVFSGVNGYQPVTTDPNYVAAGVPQPAARAHGRHSADLLPGYQQGQDSAAVVGRDGLPGGQPGIAPRLHPVVELHHRAQAAGRVRGVRRIRRDGIGERLRVPGCQCFADTRFRQCRAAAVCEIRTDRDHHGSSTAARTATTTRCKPRSTGASQGACS